MSKEIEVEVTGEGGGDMITGELRSPRELLMGIGVNACPTIPLVSPDERGAWDMHLEYRAKMAEYAGSLLDGLADDDHPLYFTVEGRTATAEEWIAWAEKHRLFVSPWYSLTIEEANRYNPPAYQMMQLEEPARYESWLPVGYIPCPRTRLGWFLYHLVHGLWMRYPLHKVLGFALAHTKPDEFVMDLLRLD